MKTYPKIQTVYDRDEDFKVIVGRHRRPVFGFISKWVVTEKIDGTNVRLSFIRVEDHVEFEVRGKSDNAQLPPQLLDKLRDWCKDNKDEVGTMMLAHGVTQMTLFGEGYGAKIQSGGYYRKDQGFILFDVQVNDSLWLPNDQMMEVARTLGLRHVPFLGIMNEEEILDLVVANYDSFVAEEQRSAEGVVAKTLVPLYDNRGERVIWKLKARDFARPR